MNQEQEKSEPTVTDTTPKPKNQKKVEAGRKGAAARWAKHKTEVIKVTKEDEPVTSVAKKEEPAETTYKDYLLPAGVAVMLGIGVYYSIKNAKQEPVVQPIIQNQEPTVIKPPKKKVVDPFD